VAAAVPVAARPVPVVALAPVVPAGPDSEAVPVVVPEVVSAVPVVAAASVAPREVPGGVAPVAAPVPVAAARRSAAAVVAGPNSADPPDADVATSKSSKRRS
jgi:hypothetical protein